MPEQLLDDAQVGPALEQMRGERVAQRVGADPIGQSGAGGGSLDRGPCLLARQPATSIAEEERAAAMITARIAYRAPQMKTNGCCLLRYVMRSPVDSNPSA